MCPFVDQNIHLTVLTWHRCCCQPDISRTLSNLPQQFRLASSCREYINSMGKGELKRNDIQCLLLILYVQHSRTSLLLPHRGSSTHPHLSKSSWLTRSCTEWCQKSKEKVSNIRGDKLYLVNHYSSQENFCCQPDGSSPTPTSTLLPFPGSRAKRERFITICDACYVQFMFD